MVSRSVPVCKCTDSEYGIMEVSAEGEESLVTSDRYLFEETFIHQIPPGRLLCARQSSRHRTVWHGNETFGFFKKIQFIGGHGLIRLYRFQVFISMVPDLSVQGWGKVGLQLCQWEIQ